MPGELFCDVNWTLSKLLFLYPTAAIEQRSGMDPRYRRSFSTKMDRSHRYMKVARCLPTNYSVGLGLVFLRRNSQVDARQAAVEGVHGFVTARRNDHLILHDKVAEAVDVIGGLESDHHVLLEDSFLVRP